MDLAIVVTVAQILGIISSISALLTTRTSQGAIAWIVSLNTFPYLAVPAYWIFGRSRFNGYVESRKSVDRQLQYHVQEIREAITAHLFRNHQTRQEQGRLDAVERIARIPFTRDNEIEVYNSGSEAYSRMFEEIQRAERYVLVQFYIVRADTLGREFQQLLLACRARGVHVYFLYDEIGSYQLPRSYIKTLRQGGVHIYPFGSRRGKRNRFQINFRNHRKVVVIDGITGFLGGLNMGDEYRGESPRFGPWRDAHMMLRGPAVVGLQLPFVEDWHWATDQFIEVEWRAWQSAAPRNGHVALVLPSGPADEVETASLMVQHAIHSAKTRLWIASPYFVPDEAVQDALKLAVLRGVDVRILIPDRPDHMLVYFSAFAFLGPMISAGIKIYRYLPGFLHQKVFLMDEIVTGIGTVNVDNRSFRLNFELTAIILGERIALSTERMFLRDFEESREMTEHDILQMPLVLRLASRLAYLLAPIQ